MMYSGRTAGFSGGSSSPSLAYPVGPVGLPCRVRAGQPSTGSGFSYPNFKTDIIILKYNSLSRIAHSKLVPTELCAIFKNIGFKTPSIWIGADVNHDLYNCTDFWVPFPPQIYAAVRSCVLFWSIQGARFAYLPSKIIWYNEQGRRSRVPNRIQGF